MKLTLDEILTIQQWFLRFKAKASSLPIKTQWNLARDMKQIQLIADEYNDFRSSLVDKVKDEFFGEEKSQEAEEPQKDENGNEVLDNDGNPIMQKTRKVKAEYMDDFKCELNETNAQLAKIGLERHEITVYPLNLDKIPEDADFSFADLEMLATFQKVSYD